MVCLECSSVPWPGRPREKNETQAGRKRGPRSCRDPGSAGDDFFHDILRQCALKANQEQPSLAGLAACCTAQHGMAFCCWIGSIDPHGELRPKCGCLGFRDWKGKNKAALRTAKTVRAGVIDLVRDLEKEHSLLVTPRGLLDDAGELEALADALLDRWLPARAGMEECVKACTVCVERRLAAVREQPADFVCAELNACLGDAGNVSVSGAAAAVPAASAGSAAGSPAVSKATLKRALSPRRQNAAASSGAHAAAPATPPREGQENQDPGAEPREFELKKQRKTHQRL